MKRNRWVVETLFMSSVALAGWPATAADVTPQRLANPEPQNWLMNHRTYDAQRFSPLDRINKDNVKGLKLAYAVAIGGTSVNENAARNAARRGRLPLHRRRLGHRLQDRRPLGRSRPHRLAHGPQAAEVPALQPRRRALGQFRHLGRELSAAHHRDRQGDRQDRLGDEPLGRAGRPAAHRGAARGQGQDHRRAPPAATAACATGSRRSMRRPASSSGANT